MTEQPIVKDVHIVPADKDYRISRHGALNTAIEIVMVEHTVGRTDPADDADLQARLVKWADWVLRYIEVPRT